MKRQPTSVMPWSLAVVLLFFPESVSWGYRPFVSTDAAVADVKEIEIELGYFNLERDRRKNTFIIPKVVLTYGLVLILRLKSPMNQSKTCCLSLPASIFLVVRIARRE